MTQHEKAAIIGYYLMGANMNEMVGVTGLDWYEIEKVIQDYSKTKKSITVLMNLN